MFSRVILHMHELCDSPFPPAFFFSSHTGEEGVDQVKNIVSEGTSGQAAVELV